MKIAIFHHGLVAEGGGERLTLEECQHLQAMGNETCLLTFYYKADIYNGRYKVQVRNLHPVKRSRKRIVWLVQKILALRKAVRELRPDFIIASGEEGCAYLALSTWGLKIPYSAHIHQTLFWDIHGYEDIRDHNSPYVCARHSFVFRLVYAEIMKAVTGSRTSIPNSFPALNIKKRLMGEFLAILLVIGVRRAKQIFVLSRKMAWEVEKIYGKTAMPIKGAIPVEVLNYLPKNDMKDRLGISDKRAILSICRLTPKKRVDLAIKAFKRVVATHPDTVLIVGGTGSEAENLKELAEELEIRDSVIFAGYIKEDEILDYYACCDIFISTDHADFDLTPYVALGLKKNVVWSVENETDDELKTSGFVFPAEPHPEGFAAALENALLSTDAKDVDMSRYTWENYFAEIAKTLADDLKDHQPFLRRLSRVIPS